MRVGIYGGSFDPVHEGHLAVAGAAVRSARLDRLLLIPAASPPHKEARSISPAEDRLAMVRLAVQGRPPLEASDLEILRGGISYTVDTIAAVAGASPRGTEVFLVIGSDTLADLPQWKDIRTILASAQVLAVHRRGADAAAVERLCGIFRPDEVDRLRAGFVEMEPVDVSATAVRDRVRRGLPIDGLVPPAVAAYIARRGLYRNGA